MRIAKISLFCVCVAGLLHAETLTLPRDERPEWVGREGIVMAGSWEPLLFRVRRDGAEGYTPTPEQRDAYAREHSPEVIARLKSLGVNFMMIHCYKGFGLAAERESMADAVRFAKLCHERGLRVGVYVYSGAFGWELLFEETPEARNWVLLDHEGKPRTYGRATYRYYWNRNHPEAQAFYRNIVRFAVRDIETDLLHFDNYGVGPGTDANSSERFRAYLRTRFDAGELERMGVSDPAAVKPPATGTGDTFLRRAWLEFSCRSLTSSYHDMSRYARSLRPDILVECNPGGVGERIRPPVHHGALLQGGEAFWDEGRPPGYRDGRLQSRIRTYKVARRMHNMAFTYTTNPLEMAESMAFNLDCLGCICWFEYGRIVEKPGSKNPISPAVSPYVRFFHKRRDLFRDASVVADIAVLRSFPSQVFGAAQLASRTSEAENELIANRIPFQIIYDHQLTELGRYRVLVLAGCAALSDRHIEQILQYTRGGGRLCIVGHAGTHDEWMRPRKHPFLDEGLPPGSVNVSEGDSIGDAIHGLCGGELSMAVEGADGLCAELTEQPGRRLVHLVNYRTDVETEDIAVSVRVPLGKRARRITLASPLREEDAALPFQQQAGLVKFTVPHVDVYEIAVVEFQ